MKRIHNIFPLILAGLVLSSCKKSFLDVSDKSKILTHEYVVDLKSTGDYLYGIYTLVGSKLYDGNNQLYPEIISDNLKPATSTSSTLAPQYNWNQVADPGQS